MRTKLPKFDGITVEASTLRATAHLSDRVGALRSGEEVFLILRAIVTDVTHHPNAEAMCRVHKAATLTAAMLEPAQGARLLEEALELADERFGIRNLFNLDNPAPDPDE